MGVHNPAVTGKTVRLVEAVAVGLERAVVLEGQGADVEIRNVYAPTVPRVLAVRRDAGECAPRSAGWQSLRKYQDGTVHVEVRVKRRMIQSSDDQILVAPEPSREISHRSLLVPQLT